MAELKISSEEIRDALAQFRDSYDPNATRSEVGAVVEADRKSTRLNSSH